MDASIILTGNVGTDIEFTQGDGWQFARFRVATTPRLRKQGDWVDGATMWMSVSCSGRLATNVLHSINKGDPVVIAGRLRSNEWVDADGQQHSRSVIEASSVGHDLTRGTAIFSKTEVPREVTEGTVAVDPVKEWVAAAS